jgi:hypothetical protein
MKPQTNIFKYPAKVKLIGQCDRKCMIQIHNSNEKALLPEGPRLLAKKPFNYFLALVSFFFVVSADILLVVSADILLMVSGAIVVVSGETEVLSFDSVLSPLLLQAAKDAAMIAIAKNFFIFEI